MNDAYAPNKREVKRMTDNEKAAYLRGRRDKACEVIYIAIMVATAILSMIFFRIQKLDTKKSSVGS